MPLPDLNIVIVNWNSGRLVERCLDSIAACTQSRFRIGDICVVDNGSEPGLVPAANAVKTDFRLIANPSNRGFAAACNQGAAGGNGSYLLFLNPDTTVLPEALDASLSFLESQAGSHAGVCGVRMLAADGSTARTCARNPIPRRLWFALLGLDQLAPNLFKGLMMRDWDHDESRDVAHVIGAFYLIRREIFNSLRGFDERFFVYLEDLDLSCRVVRAGWSIHYLASASIIHVGGGASSRDRASRLFFALQSRVLFVHKHFGKLHASHILAGTLTFEFTLRLLRGAATLSLVTLAEILRAYLRLWQATPSLLRRLAAPPN